MKIQYASDLHLEFSANREYLKKNPIEPIGDILVLAGDIVTHKGYKEHKNDFFKYVSDNFKHVYWISGNHEWYHSDLDKYPIEHSINIFKNVTLVNNLSVIRENVKFIFSTLWTKISKANAMHVRYGLNDFNYIKFHGMPLTIENYNQMHDASLEFVKKELELKNTEKTIVVTHHVPTFMKQNELYKGSLINEAFYVELHDLIADSNADYWIYGHTHHNNEDYSIGNCKMLTNQLGYVHCGEHQNFKHNSIIII